MLDLWLLSPAAGEGINWFSWAHREHAPPLFFALLNFVALVFLLRKLALPKIRAMSDRRHERTQRDLDEARRLHREAKERRADYQHRLEAIDREIAGVVAAIRAEAEAEVARAVRAAEEQAARLKRESEFTISQELKQLRIDLTRETTARAIAAAEKLIREKFTDADQRRLTEQFVRAIEGAGGPEAGAGVTRPSA
jgi:F-type H+-transporting ATPase subunit b